MKKTKSASPIFVIGIALAVLIGIAYLAQNIVGSQASTNLTLNQLSAEQQPNPVAPYPACQTEYDAALKQQQNNYEYRRLHDELVRLLKRRQELLDIIYNNPDKYTEGERATARAELMVLQQQISEAVTKYNQLRNQIWAAYNECVRGQKKQRGGNWWGRLFSPSPTTSTTSSRTTIR